MYFVEFQMSYFSVLLLKIKTFNKNFLIACLWQTKPLFSHQKHVHCFFFFGCATFDWENDTVKIKIKTKYLRDINLSSYINFID